MKKLDKQGVGIVIGLIMPLIGVFVYYKIAGFRVDFWTFLREVKQLGVTSKVLSLGVLANLVVFLIFTNLKADRLSRGIVVSTFIYAAVILVLKFLI